MAYRAGKSKAPGQVAAGRRASRSPDVGGPKAGANRNVTPQKGAPTVQVIAEIEKQRENRRKAMAAAKKERREENVLNEKMGRPGDVDFQRMIKSYRQEHSKLERSHAFSDAMKINICVRKRPVNKKEVKKKDHDSVTCYNPVAVVHECRLRVDGITKYLDNNEFTFDHTFGETATNEQVYKWTAQSMIEFIFEQHGRATVFAYGQTGSGKTHTMEGIQRLAAIDIFKQIDACQQRGIRLSVGVSFFEIYGGRCQDLLHQRRRLIIREDGKSQVQIAGLEQCFVSNVQELLQLIERGNKMRTTHATEVNDQSSRSHAICQISICSNDTPAKLHGKLSLIDLAGSERGADTKSHNRQRRMESAEINKSLLALKECIRALDSKVSHVPFRASKLTQVLKDSFVNANARTVMIATVSPCSSSTDHTVNTLRYADRVKEKTGGMDAMRELYNKVPKESRSPAAAPLMPPPPPARAQQPARRPGTAAVTPTVTAAAPAAQDEEEELEEEQRGLRDSISSQDDIKLLHHSLRKQSGKSKDNKDDINWEHLHETVQTLYEEEENLLNAHMNAIQENAELLTEEGVLLASIQGDNVIDYDIDAYSSRLEQILEKKVGIIQSLREKLKAFRRRLEDEESVSKKVNNVPLW